MEFYKTFNSLTEVKVPIVKDKKKTVSRANIMKLHVQEETSEPCLGKSPKCFFIS